MNEVKAKAKVKEITEKVWFKRLSTIGIIIFSIGIPMYALMVYVEGETDYIRLLLMSAFIPSIILSLIIFFIILYFFESLPPMGKKIALPLIWITGLPGFIVFVDWFVLWFIFLLF